MPSPARVSVQFLLISALGLSYAAGCGSEPSKGQQDEDTADTDDLGGDVDDGDEDLGDGDGTVAGDDPPPPPPPPPPAPITNAGNAARTGWYANQPGLNPAIVAGTTFGRRFTVDLPGGPLDQVYAQPLVFDGRVFVVTELNNVYALDAETGAILESANLGDPWDTADLAPACPDLVPNIGITGTPVIDAVNAVAYLLSKTYDEPSGEPVYLAHALDTTTLLEKPGFPIEIQGVADNDPNVSFAPLLHLQRPGLLLLDGVVYAAFGGQCDVGFYSGWVVGFTPEGVVTAMFAAETGPDSLRGSGIWQSGSGLMADDDGRIFFVTGNSFSTAARLPTPGATPPGSLGQAMVRLRVEPNGTLAADDFFIPYNVRALDDNDVDFGSGGPVALPDDVFGTDAHPRLAIAVGKVGILYVFDRDDLGGHKQGANGDDAVLGRVNLIGGAWSRPAIWPGDGGLAYFVLNNARIQVMQYAVDGAGNPSFANIGQGETELGYTSGSPIVTSDGTTSGTALVWTVATTGAFGNGELRAYDAVPDEAGVVHQRYADSFGAATKFFSPGVGDGRLYVGTRDGRVIAYGAPATSPVTVAATDFGTVVVGNTVTRTVTISANQALLLESITIIDPAFTVDVSALALPVTMAAGEEISVDVTFEPDDSGLFLATLDIGTSVGDASASLRGSGQTAGPKLVLSSPFVSFGGVTTNDTFTVNVIAKNVGAQVLIFSGSTDPASPFFTQNVPAAASTLASGASVTFTIGFHPTTAGAYDGTFTLASNGGSDSIGMSGTAAAPGHMVITPMTVDFGDVAVGDEETQSFTVANDGGTYIVIAKSKPPITAGFSAVSSLDEGTRINPGASRTINVKFAPVTVSAGAEAFWTITATDGQGVQNVRLTGNGVP